MARPTKCMYCGIKDEEEKIIVGRKRAHEKCRREKEIEKQEWDALYEYIRNLTGCVQVPPRNIKRLHEIKQKYKITYGTILDGFKIAENKIVWFMNNVRHGGNSAEDINAYITVMLNSGLNEAVRQKREIENRERINEMLMKQTTDIDMSTNVVAFKTNKKDDRDISDWLD